LTPRDWRRRSETVSDLLRDHIEVISVCTKCDLKMPVDLRLVARVSGPRTSLWNRKARCRRLGCAGFVEFHAKFWGMNIYQPMRAPDED
ncbi:MAG TPA: hypothetical protein VKT78_12765, partial [Fimbriimonadaceae bacterium]|nr:hypothetical protein [Fimbriimonadaceae bacterium]